MTPCPQSNCVTIRISVNEPLVVDVVGAHAHISEGESIDVALELALQDVKAHLEHRRHLAAAGHPVSRGGVA